MSKGSRSRVTDKKAYDKRYLPKAKRCAGCGKIMSFNDLARTGILGFCLKCWNEV